MRRIRFEGFQVINQVVDCTVDIHAGGMGASRREKLNSVETVGEVVWEKGPFSKLHVVLVGN
jgi:hypothetical protein